MLLQLIAFAFGVNQQTDEAKAAAAQAWNQFLVLLLGVGLGIIGIVFVISGTKAGAAASTVVEAVATKGKSLV